MIRGEERSRPAAGRPEPSKSEYGALMRERSDRRVMRVIAAIAGALLGLALSACGADKTTSPNSLVASVQIIATPTNPRVGQTSLVSATPVNAGGVQVQGVSCTYSSSASGI